MKSSVPWRAFCTWRWLVAFLVTCLLALLCVALGQWQWDRRAERVAKNEVIFSNYDQPPGGLAQAIAAESAWTPAWQWTPVELTGTYLIDQATIIRSRPLNKAPGFYAVVPFADQRSGQVLLVNRGWFPTGDGPGGLPAQLPQTPTGTVTAKVALRSAEPWQDTPAPAGQAFRITPAELHPHALGGEFSAGTGALVSAGFGVLIAETPVAAGAPVILPRPETDEGPHLSYSMQWYVFAAGCFVGLGVAARRSSTWRNHRSSSVPVKRVRQRQRTAEEEEDALLDAQGS